VEKVAVTEIYGRGSMEKHVDPIVNPIDPPSVEYGYGNLFYGSFFWDEATVHARLEEKMRKAYHTVQEAIRDKKVHPRLAAMVVGVARVAEACKLRGWV
jgi:hypothetical protein